jgi:hypothetical protein
VLGSRISNLGTTRFVVVLRPVALKIAKGEHGRRCNRHEHDLYRDVSERRRAMLCPTIWCSPFGIILVMRAATRTLSEEEKDHLLATGGFPDWDWEPGSPHNEHPFEWKPSD